MKMTKQTVHLRRIKHTKPLDPFHLKNFPGTAVTRFMGNRKENPFTYGQSHKVGRLLISPHKMEKKVAVQSQSD
jgi:hypothetical protein